MGCIPCFFFCFKKWRTPYAAMPWQCGVWHTAASTLHRAAPPPWWVMWQGTWNDMKVVRPFQYTSKSSKRYNSIICCSCLWLQVSGCFTFLAQFLILFVSMAKYSMRNIVIKQIYNIYSVHAHNIYPPLDPHSFSNKWIFSIYWQ